MTDIDFESLGAGRVLVSGRLTFATATKALEISKRLFANHSELEIDLGDVSACDSAGLAILIEWLSQAKADGRSIVFRNIPEQLLAIARISEVEDLLPRAAA